MPKANQISLTLSTEDAQAVANALTVLESKVPFLINLTKAEKKALKIMGDKSQPLVEKALEIAKANPAMAPGFTDIAEMERDFSTWKTLRPIANRILSLADQFDDTMAALGSDALRATLDIYAHVQMAADRNITGANAALDQLKPFFERAKQKEEPVTI